MTIAHSPIQADVVIVGTGMVGSLLAIALAPFSRSIYMLDKVEHDVGREMAIHSRPLSLNKASIEALQQYGLWQSLEPYATSIKQVHVSQNGYLGTTQFSADDYGLQQLGAVVPADVLALTLLKTALSLPVVHFQKIDDIEALTQSKDKAVLNYQVDGQPQILESGYIFGCDGSHSKVAQCIGSESIQEGETLVALVCDLAQANLNHIAYERFTQQGTLALLPKMNHCAGLVFTGTQEEVEPLAKLDDVNFMRTVQMLMGDRLSPSVTPGPRFKKTLESLKHVPLAKERALLLGNAARTLYPIAAQGFNLGLRDVMQLQAIVACCQDDLLANAEQVIQTFLKMREEDQKSTSKLTSTIGSVFEKNIKGFSHVRGLGLIGLDLLTPLKNKIADRALGVTGGVKRVLKLVNDERA